MTPPARGRAARIRVAVTDARGRPLSNAAVAGLGAWLARAAPGLTRGQVTVALVSDAAMRRLNGTFRGNDRVTDVLSFPAAPERKPAPRGNSRRPFLGDLAIARGVAARQARRLGHSLREELRVLALHGLLHLLGYDHDTDRGEMSRLEERLRVRAGLPSGLISRSRKTT